MPYDPTYLFVSQATPFLDGIRCHGVWNTSHIVPSYSATICWISVSHLLTSRVHNSVHASLGLGRPHPLQKMQHLWSEHSNVLGKETSFSWFAVASFQAYYKQSKTGWWEGLGMTLGLQYTHSSKSTCNSVLATHTEHKVKKILINGDNGPVEWVPKKRAGWDEKLICNK